MAEVLALLAAFLFAVAATFQQKGALGLGVSPDSLRSFARLARSNWWLFGTIALLVGYAVQAVALDHGRLAIIQPLLVTTVVFALPLGYLFTQQQVGSREVAGAAIVVGGLALFAIFGDPSTGNDDAPNDEWAITLVLVGVLCGVLLSLARRAEGSREAALYGVVSGVLFGISACLVKPTVETLHDGIPAVLSSWEFYAMAIAGISAFALQQVSLSSGFLATSVATVSTANPIVSVLVGTLLFDERLSRPAWHVVVAFAGLALAMIGAAVISIARESGAGAAGSPASEPAQAVT
ncbi:MAG TPA: DMT family transporter [Gaiellaceae bacterium]|nr:DMT family transporter [Gaiellaceae bacterium]